MEQSQTRIKIIFEALNTTPNAFAINHSLNVPTVYGFANGVRSPSFDTLVRICAAEPRISAEYLLRGEGGPLRDKHQAENLTTVEQLRQFRTEIIQSLDKRIQELGG